jgi:broad specificity phosphatase PhoE
MQKRIYLIRHGDKEKMAGDPPLTSFGLKQAQATASYFAAKNIHQILASPLLRTQQTAQIIAESLNLPVVTHQQLVERANWGDHPHQSFAEFIEMWTKATNDRDWQPPVGDSSIAAGERLAGVIDQALVERNDNENLLLVTHGGIIADFVLNMFSVDHLNTIKPGFSIGRENMIDECSVTLIEKTGVNQDFNLTELGNTQHLSQL